jgi:NTP pyrophosphatase (non-canonical NTP hydrolase)
MDFEDYQEYAHSTARYSYPKLHGKEINWLYPALGLAGEAGELSNKFKKILRDYDGDMPNDILYDIKSEMGDVLWYLAEVATCLNISLEDVASSNITKLQRRLANGTISGSGDHR